MIALATAAILTGAAGCTDTVVQPKSTITSANIFNDPNSYKAFLAKLYAGLAVSGEQGPAGNPDISGIDEGFSQYLRLYWEAEELPTDEAAIAWNDVGLPEMNTQMWAASNSFVVAMYYRIYFQVGMVNEFLRETSDAALASRGNVDPALKAKIGQYRAEARFLRALAYWHGMDLFGNIPLVTEADPLGATPPKQATRAAIYSFVVSELKAIRDSLPQPGPDMYGRATTQAANMLLAEVYLNAGVYAGAPDYTDALTAAQAVINSGAYSLDPSYQHLFEADNNTSPEIIFAVPQDGQHTQTWGGVTFLVHASCGGNMNNASYGIDGCWWGLRLKPQAYNLFSAGDGRASTFYTNGQTVDMTSIPNFNAGIADPKFTNMTSTGHAGSNATFVDTDFPMFRLGEAYLIYAEAALRGGGGSRAQALAYVNALRERAYGGTGGDITDAQLTLPFLLNERGRELLWEAHRRTDLVRFGEFTGGSYVWAWKGGTQAGGATDSFRDLYPIPESELVANPNLKQNPGY
ncbi:MAG: RagB/SusD family nutrient uptake outer membrane protein [Gemmatimonadota bacterium]|nr:RagB/SusD family nutrient uptake outer membrane protein [Gemmatimonadota bacterium]MDE3171600.1 RagB/SusD family nutrient uptake outer membrane protein [Gemmatimonadota bacterium]MDE3214828.1 RagB/SusD family nutrient uptake outer membrane protein [Gemmatimonadota bacterium]